MKSKKEHRRNLRKKAKSVSSSESELDTNQDRDLSSESEDELEKEDRERRSDLNERDAFAKRMVEKDKEKTRNVMSKSDKKVLNSHNSVLCFLRCEY